MNNLTMNDVWTELDYDDALCPEVTLIEFHDAVSSSCFFIHQLTNLSSVASGASKQYVDFHLTEQCLT